MSDIRSSIEELIGETPIMRAERFKEKYAKGADILVKLECMNPAGSVKDRAALYMIRDAEEKGILKKGGTVIEPTSGNTGIGLAAVCAARGYNAILVLPDTMSKERRDMLRAYGAKLVLTDGKKGMLGALKEAERLHSEIEGSMILGQFDNAANAYAHYMTTGPEIYRDTDGEDIVFVATVGTGGTLTGCARYLKEKNPRITVIAVEPESSPLLSKGYAGAHKIQGIGANFVPSVLDRSLIDRIITVSDEDAFRYGREFALSEGIIVGISSGAALSAAVTLAKEDEYKDKTIVALLPDSGDRYLSSEMFI